MIYPMKLIKMEKQWQKFAAANKRGMPSPRTNSDRSILQTHSRTSAVAEKGHFIAYTADEKRFMIPLAYLKTKVFEELFKMAEEEFGVSSEGPITLPCDSVFLENAISAIRRPLARDLEKASLLSLESFYCSESLYSEQEHGNQQLLACSF
ncbi:hypothetical protein Droror1_Dr00005987 [Drosera rotundifolia]